MFKPKTYHKPLLILFACIALNSKAQTRDSITYNPDKLYYWYTVSIGGGTYAITGALSATLLINNKLIFSGQYNSSSSLDFFTSHLHQAQESHESSLLTGIKLPTTKKYGILLLSGLSYVHVVDLGDVIGQNPKALFNQNIYGDNKIYNGLGIPVYVKLLVAPTGFLAFDFSVSANFNKQRTICALTFGMALGKIRKRKFSVKK